MDVSVLLLTFNEERNIGTCLEALRWCDDVWAVDSGSTDGTLEVLQAHGVHILTRAFDDFASQRNDGLNAGDFRHDWILHLDADEIVTPEFVDALHALTPIDGVDAWRVPSKLMLYGRWLRHAGMYPAYQVRLGHRERLRFIQVGHGQREALSPGRVAVFPVPYLHYSFSHGMRHWLVKHVRYAQDEARLIAEIRSGRHVEAQGASDATQRRRAAKALAARVPGVLRPVARFAYVYLWRRGFLDGRAGLTFALMMAVYEGMVAIFDDERRLGHSARVEAASEPLSEVKVPRK